MTDRASAPSVGLRERKKLRTRAAIADAAKKLFEQRGFDNVTVAEVAEAADISAKTLFTYFASKEDLLFDDEGELKVMILAAIRDRAPGQSVLDAIRAQVDGLASAKTAPDLIVALDGVRRSLGDNPTLHARLRLMWERYEDAIAEMLAQDAGMPKDDPRPRMVAVQIVALYRLLTSDVIGKYLSGHAPGKRPAAVRQWFKAALDVMEHGIGAYGRKSR
jgi:AcrR family transcriptional regulator